MKDSPFDKAHREWLQSHLERRSGETRDRLEGGHAHAEQAMLRHVWWPAFGNLQFLHPEYEVRDYYNGSRFVDLAYIRSHIRIAIEIDGFGPHVKNLTRKQFANQWVRHMHLLNDGWTVVRIPYDDIEARPRLWQQLLQQMIGRLFGDGNPVQELDDMWQKEIVRLAIRLSRPIRMEDVQTHLDCSYRTAREHIRALEQRQWLLPASGGSERVHSWTLTPLKTEQLLRF